MEDTEGKHILFYSYDKQSAAIREELDRSPLLKGQFFTFCVNNANYNIPKLILKIGVTPIIVVSGSQKPLVAQEAVDWVKNNSLSSSGKGSSDYEYVELGKSEFSSTYSETST